MQTEVNLESLLMKWCPNGVKYFWIGELEDSKKISLGRGYYLNPESWTLGELTATYEGVGEFRFSYLGEIRYGFFKKEVIHQRKNRAKADQIEKLLLKINADIAKEKQKSNRYYQESAEILSNVNRKKPEDGR